MTTMTELKGNWDEQKVKLKQVYGVLNDEDLVFESGKKLKMLENLQFKLGKTQEQLYKIIEAL